MTLQALNLTKTFEEPAPFELLRGVSLTLEPGEMIAITGKSGEGKSTLLHILGTLEPSTSGTLTIQGIEVTTSNAANLRSHHIGFIFQAFHLLEDLTALENVLMPAKIARRSVEKSWGERLLDEVGLTSRAGYPVRLLSGGEKQRVAIARALCNDPALLLADEPSGNLDAAHSAEIHALLLEAAKKRNKTLIIVTHDKNLSSLCDKTYELSDGVLLCNS